jgi:hypothetical protein
MSPVDRSSVTEVVATLTTVTAGTAILVLRGARRLTVAGWHIAQRPPVGPATIAEALQRADVAETVAGYIDPGRVVAAMDLKEVARLIDVAAVAKHVDVAEVAAWIAEANLRFDQRAESTREPADTAEDAAQDAAQVEDPTPPAEPIGAGPTTEYRTEY